MNLRTRPRTRRSRAFTLIELMVVVLILAVLAALVVPKVVGQGETAKVGAAKADLQTIKTLLDTFHLDNGRYPTNEEGLSILSERTAPSGLESSFKGPYSSKPVGMDPWGHEYVYDAPSNSEFTVTCYGADGVEGGDGNNADLSVND